MIHHPVTLCCVTDTTLCFSLTKFFYFTAMVKPTFECVSNLEMARPYQHEASQWAGRSLTPELHTCPRSANKHTFLKLKQAVIKSKERGERKIITRKYIKHWQRKGSAFTLWWGSIFRRRGGIILTASCRLMLPCNDKHKNVVVS